MRCDLFHHLTPVIYRIPGIRIDCRGKRRWRSPCCRSHLRAPQSGIWPREQYLSCPTIRKLRIWLLFNKKHTQTANFIHILKNLYNLFTSPFRILSILHRQWWRVLSSQLWSKLFINLSFTPLVKNFIPFNSGVNSSPLFIYGCEELAPPISICPPELPYLELAVVAVGEAALRRDVNDQQHLASGSDAGITVVHRVRSTNLYSSMDTGLPAASFTVKS